MGDLVAKLRRASAQRLTAADYLLANEDLWLEAMYIAGYSVEIALKALILDRTPIRKREAIFRSFRGAGWHDLLRLKKELAQRGVSFPPPLMQHFTRVATWSTEIRYDVGRKRYEEADLFLKSSHAIFTWVEENLS